MFVASVALTYAAWESYIEDVSVEVSSFISASIAPERVPKLARKAIESRDSSAWALSVYPGWRQLWQNVVTTAAKGDESKSAWGINTAGPKQIDALSTLVGINILNERIFGRERADLLTLIELRGSVVHTASASVDFKKATAVSHRDLIVDLVARVDSHLKAEAVALVAVPGLEPWV